MDKTIVGNWEVLLLLNGQPLSSNQEAVHMNLVYKPGDKWYVLLYSGFSYSQVPVISVLVDLKPLDSTLPILTTHTVPPWPAGSWTGHELPPDNEGRIFCSGHVMLEDGRLIVVGGHKILTEEEAGHVFLGLPTTYIFNPASITDANPRPWSYVLDNFGAPIFMSDGRWYPTVTRLHDKRIVVVSGWEYKGTPTDPPQDILNKRVEVYPDGDGKWKLLRNEDNTIVEIPFEALYPGAHMLPFENSTIKSKAGEVFYTMPMTQTWRLNVDGNGEPDGKYFNQVVERETVREHCNSILLTIESNSMKVLLIGGHDGTDALESVEIIDVNDPNPQWTPLAGLNIPRFNSNSVILPDKRILVVGGCQGEGGRQNAVTIPELYNPYYGAGQGNSTMQRAMTYPRMYHSTAILTPDATVLVSGGETLGEFANGNQRNFEIFSPGYLFHDPDIYPRPTILTDLTEIYFNETFSVISDVNHITSVMLIRFGCPTHAFDQDQRAIELQFSEDGKEPENTLTITAPANAYIAPAGLYMLFILRDGPFNQDPYNQVRIPSVAKIVKLKVGD